MAGIKALSLRAALSGLDESLERQWKPWCKGRGFWRSCLAARSSEGEREQSCRTRHTRQIYSRKPKNIVEGSMIEDLLGVRADLQLYCESCLQMRHRMVVVLEAALHQNRGLTSR